MSSSMRPVATTAASARHDGEVASAAGGSAVASPLPLLGSGGTVESTLKSDILASVKSEITMTIRMEMNAALTGDFNCRWSEWNLRIPPQASAEFAESC